MALLGTGTLAILPGSPASATPDDRAETSQTVELIDLGSLGTTASGGRLSAVNNRGNAVGTYVDDGHLIPAVFNKAERSPISGAFPDWLYVTPREIADNGTIAGTTSNGGTIHMFRMRDGAVIELGPGSLNDLTESGDILTLDSVLHPDGSQLDLASLSDYLEAAAMTEDGVVVGMVDVQDGHGTDYRAFRSVAGEPVDPARDLLPWEGAAAALDVSESGLVVGYGRGDGGGYVPLVWDADGNVHQPQTPFGGQIAAVDATGTAVGTMRDGDGADRAALFQRGGDGEFLQELLPEESPWVLDDAVDLNDHGVVLGHMHRIDQPHESHGYMLDLSGSDGPDLVGVTAEERDYPAGDWKQLSGSATTDGNAVRLGAIVHNTSPYPASVTVEFQDENGNPLEGGRFTELLMGDETITENVEIDTAGLAWSEDSPRTEPYAYRVVVSQAGTALEAGTVDLRVDPRPVVLVHGYKSDAPSSWDVFKDLLPSGHPGLTGYAVGDGQYPGRMNTGSLAHPFTPTNSIAQNAAEEATYVEALRDDLEAWHVDIVAHSMGGLISRYYLQELMPPAPADGRPVVNRLIQVGTPNMGSPCADELLNLSVLGATPLMPATLQLSQPYLEKYFNIAVRVRRGVPISNLSGRGQVVPCGIPTAVGDLVVPDYSSTWTLTDVVPSDVNHLEMTEDQQTLDEYVMPRLRTVTTAPPSDVRRRTTASTEVPDAFAVTTLTVPAGETRSLPLDPGDATSVGVTLSGSDLTVDLVDPEDEVADSVEAGSSASRAPFTGLVAEVAPGGGAWTLRVENTGDQHAEVPVVAWLDGSATSVSLEATAAETGRVAVTATVQQKTPGDATVTASLVDSSGDRTTVDLVDDGEHGDGEAGDGVYGGESAVLPDGPAAVAVDADTAVGHRIASTAVEVARVDRSPRTLTLTAQPGGTAAADPAGPTYPYGSTVTVTAKPHPGETSLGWRVDGKHVPAGPLELTMDRHHDVVALFGHYTITEIPALPGGRPENSEATALNDRGEVAVTALDGPVVGGNPFGRQRAAVYDGSELTQLPGLECTPHSSQVCDQTARGIDDHGNVVGSSYTVGPDGMNWEHATKWHDGVPVDLHPAGMARSSARTIGDNGQVLGGAGADLMSNELGVWSQGSFRRITNDALNVRTFPGGRMNAKGQVALDWVTYDAWGRPIRSQAALLAGRAGTKLPSYEGCPPDHSEDRISSGASGINLTGTVVGWALCDNSGQQRQAMVWKDGEATSLGEGVATDVNDGGLVVGTRWTGVRWVPTMWNGTQHVDLETLMPAACPAGRTPQVPCVELETLIDVNNSGQMIASGYVHDRSARTGDWERSARSFLLSPSTADADLSVEQGRVAAEIAPGAGITRTATVTNTGPDTATGVVVDLALPGVLDVVGCSSDAGDCVAVGQGRRVVVPELAAGATVKLTVTATVPTTLPKGTVLTTTASAVSRAVRDRVPGNDVAAVTTTVKPIVDAGLLFADPVPVNTDSVALSLPLTNRTEAPLTVRSVVVSDGFRATAACEGVLSPGQSCPVTVVFRPTEARAYAGVASIETAELGVVTFSLAGTGKAANGKPVIAPPAPQVGTVGQPFTLRVPFTDPDPADTHSAQIVWPNGGGPIPVDRIEEKDGSGVIVATRTFSSTVARDSAILILKDSADNTTLQPITFSITDRPANTAPVVLAGGDVDIEAGTELLRLGSFTDTGSTSWTATVDYGSGPQPLALDGHEFTLAHVFDQPGTYPVTVGVQDEQGLSGKATFTVTVRRVNHAPVLTVPPTGSIDEGRRWTVSGTVTDPDAADRPTLTVDYGDGTVEAVTPAADGTFALAHQWADDGVERVVVNAADGSGGAATSTVDVTVSNVAPIARILATPADRVVFAGTAVELSGSFEDLGAADTHTATWSTGSSTVVGKVDEANGRGSVTGSVVFDEPGSYRLALTVTDDDGATHRVDEVDGKPVLVTVVREDSMVTVRGAVDAPRGSCTLVPDCGSAGNAPIAVGATYWPGRTTPVGAVTLTAGHFKLVGTSLETLVTADGRGTITGTGVVNGTVGVRFIVDLVGGSGSTPGKARLRVWRQSDGALVFDNARSGIDGTAGRVNGEVFVH